MLPCFLIFILLRLSVAGGQEEEPRISEIKLVGFFDAGGADQEVAFRFAVERINIDFADELHIEPLVEHVATFDSYNTSKRLCDLLSSGVGGIIGPPSPEASGFLESMSRSLDLPLVKTFWDVSRMPAGPAVNVYPDPSLLAKALVAVIEDMDWKKYAVIYEADNALIRIHELLKSHKRALTQEGHVPFTVWQLDPGGDYRPLLKKIGSSGETNIVLDCSTENILNILYQAQEVKMLTEYHSYVLTSLDAHTLDYADIKEGSTNITTLRIISSHEHNTQAAVQDMVFSQSRKGKKFHLTANTIKTDAALMYDAVYVFSEAVRRLGGVEAPLLSCSEDGSRWEVGANISQSLKETETRGMTGVISFDKETGRRNFFTIEITQLIKNGFRKIGSWDPVNKMSYTRTRGEMESELFQSISNKTFVVVSRIGEPYLMRSDDGGFKGYAYDLIDEIAKDLNFKYKFYLAPDNAYGSFNKITKQWNGLIKELRERRADLAICDLTITYERRSAVDFTMPFMTLGISILYAKPTKQPPDLFSFLLPFSVDVWIYMATAYLGVSLLLYFIARCAPDDWENPHPCDPNPTELENTWSLHNCLWFSIGSLMQQGCDLLPKALSTRIVAGMWWFFILIMISSYTANLAAFLTMDRMDSTIGNVEDLASQVKVKYGVMKGGSSSNFFQYSNVSLYQKMWSAMESARPSVFVESNGEGVERVLKGDRKFAFFMESTTIEYQKEKYCELMQVGGLLDSKGYGIAMPFNSPYRIAVSGAVLKLQESGKLAALKDKWWKNPNKTCDAEDEGKGGDSAELGIANVGGVFLVLIVGCSAAFVVSIFEFLWNVRKVARDEKLSPGQAFCLELMFALRCYGTTKPVRKKSMESAGSRDKLEKVPPESDGRGDYYGAKDSDDDLAGRGLCADDSTLDDLYPHLIGLNNHKNSRAMSYH